MPRTRSQSTNETCKNTSKNDKQMPCTRSQSKKRWIDIHKNDTPNIDQISKQVQNLKIEDKSTGIGHTRSNKKREKAER